MEPYPFFGVRARVAVTWRYLCLQTYSGEFRLTTSHVRGWIISNFCIGFNSAATFATAVAGQ